MIPITQERTSPSTVARPAPRTPMPKTPIKSQSRTMFAMPAESCCEAVCGGAIHPDEAGKELLPYGSRAPEEPAERIDPAARHRPVRCTQKGKDRGKEGKDRCRKAAVKNNGKRHAHRERPVRTILISGPQRDRCNGAVAGGKKKRCRGQDVDKGIDGIDGGQSICPCIARHKDAVYNRIERVKE